jgi:hypothetical protein
LRTAGAAGGIAFAREEDMGLLDRRVRIARSIGASKAADR